MHSREQLGRIRRSSSPLGRAEHRRDLREQPEGCAPGRRAVHRRQQGCVFDGPPQIPRSAGRSDPGGVLSFGYFSLDKQRKVTRGQAPPLIDVPTAVWPRKPAPNAVQDGLRLRHLCNQLLAASREIARLAIWPESADSSDALGAAMHRLSQISWSHAT